MITPTWYSTPERIASLRAEASRWAGTPFSLGSRVCGPRGGVDCGHLAAELHFATGCLPRFEVPGLSPRMFMHDALERGMLASFDALTGGRFAPVSLEEPREAGDALFLSYGSTCQHMVTLLGAGLCVHAMARRGVLLTPLDAVLGLLRGSPRVVAMRRPQP